jgi:hypothetical protein
MSPSASGVLPEKPRMIEHPAPSAHPRPALEKQVRPSASAAPEAARPAAAPPTKSVPIAPMPPGARAPAPTSPAQAMSLQSAYGNAALARAATSGELALAPKQVAPPLGDDSLGIPTTGIPAVTAPTPLEKTPAAAKTVDSPVLVPSVTPDVLTPPAAPIAISPLPVPAPAAVRTTPSPSSRTPQDVTAEPGAIVPSTDAKPITATVAHAKGQKPDAGGLAASRIEAEDTKSTKAKSAEAGPEHEASGTRRTPIPAGGVVGSPLEPGTSQKPVSISAQNPGGILEQLASVPPTQADEAYGRAEGASARALEEQKKEVQKSVPQIPAPSGLPPRGSKTIKKEEAGDAAQRASAAHLVEERSGRAQKPYSTEVEALPAAPPPPPVRIAAPEAPADQAESAELAHEAQASLEDVQTDAPPVSTSAGERPSVDVSHEANPDQVASSEEKSGEQVSAAKTQAAGQVDADFGENSIFPEPSSEKLKSNKTFTALRPKAAKAQQAADLPPEAARSVNASLGPVLAERVGAKKKEYDLEDDKFKQDQAQAHQDADAERARLESEARKTQLEEQARAKKEVSGSRGTWRSEIESVEKDYQEKASKAGNEKREEIAQRKKKGEEEAANHLKDAEQKAAAEKAEAERKAEKEKADKKKESHGFWGWVKSAASAVIDGLKKAVNFIYDNLRKAVKIIFEAAKKLALAAIELARQAIVLAIKGFGLILKGIVSVAFAAFPSIRSKILSKIDKVVNTAVNAVNKAAEVLKKGVTAVLDFLANTLDKLLGLIQSIYNGIFTVIGMLIRGEFREIIRRIGYLVDAAKTVPDQFETAALEELLGGNLDEPLSPMELMQAKITPPAAQAEAPRSSETADNSELPASPWSENNVGVDEVEPNMELSPELAEEVAQTTGGEGETELASSTDESRTMTAVMAEVSPTGAAKGEEKEEAKYPDDGLNPRKRAEIKWALMKEGIAQWWSDNWPKVILGAVGALVAFIALNIVTGGAITAALPAIMGIVGPLFAGLTILTLADRAKDYLEQGWNGQIRPAGKSLAKGLAAGAIELISYLTFKAGGLALKGAKALAKGAKVVAAAGVKLAKAGVALIKRGIKFIISKAKVLFQGIAHTGIGRFFKRLKDMGEELLKRLRFRKFRIRFSGPWFFLEGFINPWVLIAKSKLVDVEKKKLPGNAKVGDKVEVTVAGKKFEGDLVGMGKKPPYRRIAGVVHPSTVVDESVIHHLIEQQTLKMTKYVDLAIEEVNAPSRLIPILKGPVNEVVHLSRIRTMWDSFYDMMRALPINKAANRTAMLKFAEYTNEFLEEMNRFIRRNKNLKNAFQAGDAELAKRLMDSHARVLLGKGGKLDLVEALDAAWKG